MMKSARSMLWPGVLIAGALFAQDAQVTPLMSKDLPEFPGKEAQMISVVYPPGASDPFTGTMRMHSCMCWRGRL